MNELAIIIPAYKSAFLVATLDSIALQTCKMFTLYIGDDHSPDDIKFIVDQYRDKINLVYKRFNQNLGSTDLVGQWERCIDMMQGETWLWLFSDDDIMEPNCVEEFYKLVDYKKNAKLVHFNIKEINKDGEIVKVPLSYPSRLDVKEYLDGKLSGKLISFVVEFIVRKDIFVSCGRFQNFDMAWGSDFISWIKFANMANGIYTCPNSYVKWRSSGINITTDESRTTVYRKLIAVISYMKWILVFSQKNGYGHPCFYSKHALGEIIKQHKKLSRDQIINLLSKYKRSIKGYQWAIVKDFLISF